MTSTPVSPRELYRRWIEELWAGRPVAPELVTDDFVGHWPDRDVHGPSELAAIVEQTRNMFAELTFAVQVGPLVDGDMLAARWVGTGRSGTQEVTFTGNDILRLASGKIAEYWTGTSAG
ncbi:ester cyclase [uncultured Mycobacterium sp.]|uniref:ester cyclase n=1 Tax=uncultured Mycobacterium sp. TaxID=171292 RepID=UPI0035CA62D9